MKNFTFCLNCSSGYCLCYLYKLFILVLHFFIHFLLIISYQYLKTLILYLKLQWLYTLLRFLSNFIYNTLNTIWSIILFVDWFILSVFFYFSYFFIFYWFIIFYFSLHYYQQFWFAIFSNERLFFFYELLPLNIFSINFLIIF